MRSISTMLVMGLAAAIVWVGVILTAVSIIQ